MSTKRGKLAKMTEEQKLLYMEEQRLKEEEVRRNKEELLAQYLKNKLVKEEKMAALNANKIKLEWRNILRSAKSKEIRQEIQVLSQVFERNLDRKDNIKQGLLKDLSEAEEQYLMAKRSHMQSVDKLIEFQKKRIRQLDSEFKEQENLLIQEFEYEKSFIMDQHKQEVLRLENIIYAMEETFLEKEAESGAEFQSNMDELKNRNLEDVHTLRLRQENLLESLNVQFRNATKVYLDATEDRKKGFDELKEKDDNSTREIETQSKRITKLRGEIARAKAQRKVTSRDWEAKNKEIRYEKDTLAESLFCLKKRLGEAQTYEKERLAKLIMLTRDVITQLKGKVSKGEHLLKAAERCRKLESEHEKVLPFYQTSLTEAELEKINNHLIEETANPLVGLMKNFLGEENFWKRHNKVAIENAALEKEMQLLGRTNEQLRQQLKLRLIGLSGNPSMLLDNDARATAGPDVLVHPMSAPSSSARVNDNNNSRVRSASQRKVKVRKNVNANATVCVQECSSNGHRKMFS